MGKIIDSNDLLPKLWDYISDPDYEKVQKVIDGMPSKVPITEPKTHGMTGWICPVCGQGLSPFIVVCPCRNKWEVTC